MLDKLHFHIPTDSLSSGYDFGYFVKLLTAVSLPTTEESFFDVLRIWFPTVYDVKFMMRACKQLKGGLQEVADDLGVSSSLFAFYVIVHLFAVAGNANWIFPSSRIRLPLDSLHFFQDE